AVRIPLRAALDVVDRAEEPVRAAARDGVDLQTTGASVFRLVRGGRNADFLNGFDADTRRRAVDTGIHRGRAVEHEVAVTAAAEPARGREVAGIGLNAGHQAQERVVRPAGERQAGHGFGRNREGLLTGRGL